MVVEKITETIYVRYVTDAQNVVNLLSISVKRAVVQAK